MCTSSYDLIQSGKVYKGMVQESAPIYVLPVTAAAGECRMAASETSLRSLRKLYIFIIKKNIFRIVVSKKTIDLQDGCIRNTAEFTRKITYFYY